MANPQTENGYIEIAVEIVQALARTQLSGYESRVVWALWRKTWGWVDKTKFGEIKRDKKGKILKKKTAIICSKDWIELTKLNKYNISRTLRGLILRQIVIKNDNNKEWGFQKDYDKWLQPIKRIVIKNDNTYFLTKDGKVFIKNDNGISRIDNKKVPKELFIKQQRVPKETLKETKKEVLQNHHLDDSKDPGKEKIIDKLMKGWGDTHPESFKFRGVGGRVKMREGISLCLTERVEPEAIAERIEEAGNQNPWHIFSDEWLEKYQKEKESYDKLIEKYSNK